MNRAPLLLMLFVLYCLLFPFCGLVLDHHFAERQPEHMHLYLGKVTPNHAHPYEVFHTHSSAHEADNTNFQETPKSDPAPDGIVYLTSRDGVSQSLAQLAASSIHPSSDFHSLDEPSNTFSIPTDDTNWRDPYLALPKKPPRL